MEVLCNPDVSWNEVSHGLAVQMELAQNFVEVQPLFPSKASTNSWGLAFFWSPLFAGFLFQ
jgi:hypothetical protein